MNQYKTITFGVIAYNEHKYLPDLLNDLLNQTYPKSLIEVILVDGESTDDTWKKMCDFKDAHKDKYREIKVLKNLKRIQPAGWNIVIKNTTSDILLRIDAHARLPEDFVEKNVACINAGENVCGGPRTNIIDEDTPWKRMLLSAEQSMFGAGVASYRQNTEKKRYVNSLFHAAYKKEVLERIGFFNECLIRTEDNEYHYRVRQAGYKICYDPTIHSYYQTRNSLKGMLKQKYLNGLWIGRTLFICRECISLFHLVPFTFVIAIVLSVLLGVCGLWWLAIVLGITYGIVNVGMTILTIIGAEKKEPQLLLLPLVFLSLHIIYGTGTLCGIVHRR